MSIELKIFRDFHDFFVRESARKEYLLDLVIIDISKVFAIILPCIADYNAIIKLPPSEVLEKACTRTIWDARKAEWSNLE